ncbi:hypothetical protein HYO43_23620 [Vibrio parahaemolyticus]|nr:hypothetical protein [Vibrio parahaemolyticus]
MTDFMLKLRACAAAATLFNNNEDIKEFSELYLKLLRFEQEELEDKTFDEQQLAALMRRFAKIEPEIYKRIRAAFRHMEKEKLKQIKAEQEQLLYFLLYMNINDPKPSKP